MNSLFLKICLLSEAVTLVGFGSLSAAIRPGFDVVMCTWNATDILIMVPAQRQYPLRVVGTIHGNTRVGSEITLGDYLFAPAGAAARLSELSAAWDHPFISAPPVRNGTRAVLFLRRPGAAPEYNPRPDLPVSIAGWQPANWWGDQLTSTVWLEDGAAYGFRQVMNPGPSRLVHLGLNESQLREEVRRVLDQRQLLDHALGRRDATNRSAEPAALVRSNKGVPRWSALAHLSAEGAAGAKVLQELLADGKLLPWHDQVINALLKTGVPGLSFAEVMVQETQYWTPTCRLLPRGWWNQPPYGQYDIAKAHYGRAYAALIAIRQRHNNSDLRSVRDFAAIWKTCPPIDERESLDVNQITQECKFLLSATFH